MSMTLHISPVCKDRNRFRSTTAEELDVARVVFVFTQDCRHGAAGSFSVSSINWHHVTAAFTAR
jgi:hypothetical protein